MAYAAELCGSKLRSKLSETFNESSAAPISTTSFAAKQMAKMGWKEGTGLGKNSDGMVSHIKVKKREDNIGIGLEKERTRKLGTEGMWWSANVGNTLMRLQQQSQLQKKDKKKRKKKSEDSKDKDGKKKSKKSKKKKDKKEKKADKALPRIYTDEELFEATGGARFGMRAQRRAEGKWKRTEKSQDLKEWEDKVQKNIEWNGLGKAQVILNDNEKDNKNNKDDSHSECTEKKEKKKSSKRKRKSDDSFSPEKKETTNANPIVSNDSDSSSKTETESNGLDEKTKSSDRKEKKRQKKKHKSDKKSKKK